MSLYNVPRLIHACKPLKHVCVTKRPVRNCVAVFAFYNFACQVKRLLKGGVWRALHPFCIFSLFSLPPFLFWFHYMYLFPEMPDGFFDRLLKARCCAGGCTINRKIGLLLFSLCGVLVLNLIDWGNEDVAQEKMRVSTQGTSLATTPAGHPPRRGQGHIHSKKSPPGHMLIAQAALVPFHQMPSDFNYASLDLLVESWNQHLITYCGSCWAHAALISVSDRINVIKAGRGIPIRLSRQVLLNCGQAEGHGTGVFPYLNCFFNRESACSFL